mmetsp:Transcript_59866/g.185532  ORF Transcript_59866/g.185532 Transcript_59866/m.185532 type:complete len:393 (-) Transcript_59866:726-1904(-)
MPQEIHAVALRRQAGHDAAAQLLPGVPERPLGQPHGRGAAERCLAIRVRGRPRGAAGHAGHGPAHRGGGRGAAPAGADADATAGAGPALLLPELAAAAAAPPGRRRARRRQGPQRRRAVGAAGAAREARDPAVRAVAGGQCHEQGRRVPGHVLRVLLAVEQRPGLLCHPDPGHGEPGPRLPESHDEVLHAGRDREAGEPGPGVRGEGYGRRHQGRRGQGRGRGEQLHAHGGGRREARGARDRRAARQADREGPGHAGRAGPQGAHGRDHHGDGRQLAREPEDQRDPRPGHGGRHRQPQRQDSGRAGGGGHGGDRDEGPRGRLRQARGRGGGQAEPPGDRRGGPGPAGPRLGRLGEDDADAQVLGPRDPDRHNHPEVRADRGLQALRQPQLDL